MNKNFFKNKNGQSIIEILVGISILTIAISAGSLLFFSNQNLFLDQKNHLQALGLASECVEVTKQIFNRDWNEITAGNHGLLYASTTRKWSYSGSSDTTGIFTRVANIIVVSNQEKDLKCSVSWNTDPDRPQTISLYYRVSNWRGLYGDWSNPKTLGTVDLGAGNQGTDVRVRNKIVYVTTKASTSSKKDFHVVDATNGSAPFVIQSIDTSIGLNALDISGNYAYVAVGSDNKQFQIIDITSNSNPFVVSSSSIPSSQAALSIAYSNGYAFLGSQNSSSGKEFNIFNVSNPSSPSIVGSYEVGGSVTRVFLKDTYAYLTTTVDDGEIFVLNVSNPVSPTLVKKYDVYGTTDGASIDIVGNLLYYGSLHEYDPAGFEFNILDISNLPTITSTGTKDTASNINDLYVKDYLVFMGTDDSNAEFKLYDISNPQNITQVSTLNFPQVATGIDYENNLIYVSLRSNDALRIVTSQ